MKTQPWLIFFCPCFLYKFIMLKVLGKIYIYIKDVLVEKVFVFGIAIEKTIKKDTRKAISSKIFWFCSINDYGENPSNTHWTINTRHTVFNIKAETKLKIKTWNL